MYYAIAVSAKCFYHAVLCQLRRWVGRSLDDVSVVTLVHASGTSRI